MFLSINEYHTETIYGKEIREEISFSHENEEFVKYINKKNYPKNRILKLEVGERITLKGRCSEPFHPKGGYERAYRIWKNKIV